VLEALERELAVARSEQLSQLVSLFKLGNYEAAAAQVRQLMFLEKFGDDVGHVFEAIEA
jgi:molecular chaperone HscB